MLWVCMGVGFGVHVCGFCTHIYVDCGCAWVWVLCVHVCGFCVWVVGASKHELTHANFKPWCAHCHVGLAQRGRRGRKAPLVASGYKNGTANGDADVPDAEPYDGRVAKFNIDHLKIPRPEEEEPTEGNFCLMLVQPGEFKVSGTCTQIRS